MFVLFCFLNGKDVTVIRSSILTSGIFDDLIVLSQNPKALRMQLDRVPGMKLDLKGVAQDRDGGASNPTSTNRLAMDTTGTDRNTQRSFNVSGRVSA